MIEFVTKDGRKYPVVEGREGLPAAMVDFRNNIRRDIFRAGPSKGDYEIFYGGHFIFGKLRAKAGRRVVKSGSEVKENG